MFFVWDSIATSQKPKQGSKSGIADKVLIDPQKYEWNELEIIQENTIEIEGIEIGSLTLTETDNEMN